MEHKVDCAVCGSELVYESESHHRKCFYCTGTSISTVRCSKGHFVCDACHSLSANELISRFCIASESEDPLEMALTLMRDRRIKMHGPEHHFLVPAVLLAAYYNVKQEHDLKVVKIGEAQKRARNILGGFCGFCGACGAAVGTGIFISLITDATPLAAEGWRQCNMMASKSLLSLATIGGPRCCKRTSYLSLLEAVEFVRDNYGIEMAVDGEVVCEFSPLNRECIKERCPFYHIPA